MPRKRVPKKLGSIATSGDHQAFEIVLKNAGVPAHKFEMAHKWIDGLTKAVLIFEKDIGLTEERTLAVKRPQLQARHFKDTASVLDGVADQIKELDQPRQRHKGDSSSEFYVPKVGTGQFDRAIGHAMAKMTEPAFLRSFGVNISSFIRMSNQRSERGSGREPLAPTYENLELDVNGLSTALVDQAAPIMIGAVRQLSRALLIAAHELEGKAERGGAFRNPVRDMVIGNIILLYRDVFDGTKPLYVDETNKDLLSFTEKICIFLNAPNYCTESYIRSTIRKIG